MIIPIKKLINNTHLRHNTIFYHDINIITNYYYTNLFFDILSILTYKMI